MRFRRHLFILSAVWTGLPFCAFAGDEIDYNRDIRPILSDKCFFCHGPEPGHREADLRLTGVEEAGPVKDILI